MSTWISRTHRLTIPAYNVSVNGNKNFEGKICNIPNGVSPDREEIICKVAQIICKVETGQKNTEIEIDPVEGTGMNKKDDCSVYMF